MEIGIEFGRLQKNEKTEIVIRADEYKGVKAITIREFIKGEKYQGFTKSGTRIPLEKWQEFKAIVNKIS